VDRKIKVGKSEISSLKILFHNFTRKIKKWSLFEFLSFGIKGFLWKMESFILFNQKEIKKKWKILKK